MSLRSSIIFRKFEAFYDACRKGSHERTGCPFLQNAVYFAARNGHFDCLQYAHGNGCLWLPMATRAAAENGHLECLRYAHENGCPWDIHTSERAAFKGHVDCLEYIYEHCGEIETWEHSGLGMNLHLFPEKSREFLESVREDWKARRNHPGKNIKG